MNVNMQGQAEPCVALNSQAIKKFARLRRPVYVTETGIADKADALRAEWAESYFKAVGLPSTPVPHVDVLTCPDLLFAF